MKKYVDILQDIAKMREVAKKAEPQIEALTDSYIKFSERSQRVEQRKRVESDITKANEALLDAKISVKLLTNNARIALLHEVLPVVVEEFSKFANKPYGEKTREKISKAIQAKTGCIVYISTGYGYGELNIYPASGSSEYNITCGLRDTNAKLLVDNRIQPFCADDLMMYYHSSAYIDDVTERVVELKALYRECCKKQRELEEMCRKYNEIATSDVKHIYADKYIYDDMNI